MKCMAVAKSKETNHNHGPIARINDRKKTIRVLQHAFENGDNNRKYCPLWVFPLRHFMLHLWVCHACLL